ncbi:hypothetical protein ABZ923_12095 [Streptomyces sp. NPDC046881]|uniref:hypothetical protein n=1 Tax=Streptomyces sp. NPDC046881 TaxID=3155374 RepID=UPI0033D2DE08
MRRILVIDGPPAIGNYCAALADAYAEGARAGGHEVRLQPQADYRAAMTSAEVLGSENIGKS